MRSCSEVDVQWLQPNFAVTAVKPPHQNQELQWSWCAVTTVQLCSDCSLTPPPPPEWGVAVKLMCSDWQWLQFNPPPPPTRMRSCSEVDVQWLQSNPPPPEWGVAVKLMCSDCSQTPPPEWGVAVKLMCSDWQWLQFNPPPHPPEWGVAVKLMCSDCSPTLQWLQSNPPRYPTELQLSNFKYIDLMSSEGFVSLSYFLI